MDQSLRVEGELGARRVEDLDDVGQAADRRRGFGLMEA